jgi:hypothetical protein
VINGSGEIVSFRPATDQIWNATDWALPNEINDLQRRLMLTNHAVGTNKADLSSAETVQVALDLLHLGQVFDDYEVITAGWINKILVVRTLLAGVGMDLPG